MNEWGLILGMFLMTFSTRYIPLVLAGKFKIPSLIERALRYVPIAVLTSIITQSSLIQQGELYLNINNYYLLATLVSFFTARITSKLFIVVAVGMFSFFMMRMLLQ